MENRSIFLVYLTSWGLYLAAMYVFGRRERLHVGIVSVSHLAPTAVAILMIYIFLIRGGGTVAQTVAGSKSGMEMWSLWASLWPSLLFLTTTSALLHLAWSIIAGVNKPQRKWIPVTVVSLLMSVFAFFTVAANFPDA